MSNENGEKEEILLSISILVSNRIDTIRKCLDSIEPLLEQIPSELIIVDTGGTDGSIDVAREYTDHIVPFTWCNDFSKARNTGLREAKGKWFMFMDDDEWFEDISELIEFFKSEEYLNFGSAQYIVRNHFSNRGDEDGLVGRLTVRTSKTHFKGMIHEHLSPMPTPVKYFDMYAHHYGYDYKDEDEAKKHFERNVSLLKQELKKDPTNVRALYQIAQEYETMTDFENETAICLFALKHKRDDVEGTKGINWLMAARVRVLLLQKKWEEAKRAAQQMLQLRPYSLFQAVIYMYMAEAHDNLKEYEELKEVSLKCINILDELEENMAVYNSQQILGVTRTYMRERYNVIHIKAVQACCEIGNFNGMEKMFDWLFSPDNTDNIVADIAYFEKCKVEYPDCTEAMVKSIANVKLEKDNTYLCLHRVLAAEYTKDPIHIQQEFDKCLVMCLEQGNYYINLLKIAGENVLTMEVFLETADREEWEKWISRGYQGLLMEEINGILQGLEETQVQSGLMLKKEAYIITLKRYQLLRASADSELFTESISYLEQYVENGLHYFKQIHRAALFEEENQINLPRECRFLLALQKSFAYRKNGQLVDCIKLVKSAIKENPDMAETVKNYCLDVEKEIERIQNPEPQNSQSEFYLLGQQIKEQVRHLIAEKRTDEALAILTELKKLLPADDEIETLIMQANDL